MGRWTTAQAWSRRRAVPASGSPPGKPQRNERGRAADDARFWCRPTVEVPRGGAHSLDRPTQCPQLVEPFLSPGVVARLDHPDERVLDGADAAEPQDVPLQALQAVGAVEPA